MTATNRVLLILDLIKGLIAIVAGNIGLPVLVQYLIGVLQPARQIQVTTEKTAITVICLVITIYCFHNTESKVIKALVVILLFIPIILMLLSYFAVLKVPMPF